MEYNKNYYRIQEDHNNIKRLLFRLPGTNQFIKKSKIIKLFCNPNNISWKDYISEYLLNLPKDNNGNYIPPKCENPECNNLTEFSNSNYKRHCSKKCSQRTQALKMSENYKNPNSYFNSEQYSKNLSEAKKRDWRNPNSGFNSKDYNEKRITKIRETCRKDKYRKDQSYSQKKRWEDPEYRKRHELINKSYWNNEDFIRKQLLENPFFTNRNSVSKISIKLFIEVIRRLPNSIKPIAIKFGRSEHIVKSRSLGDTAPCRRLDFYIPELNKWIEFNGDYYHKNPKCMHKGCNAVEFADTWYRDRQRNKIISKILNTKPLIIWESDYKKDPDKIINKCINFITNSNE